MATYIKTLQDGDGNFIAPRTNTDAITTPSGGSLSGLIVAGDDPIVGSPIYTPATQVSYSNTISGLLATDVQNAIDELNNKYPEECLILALSDESTILTVGDGKVIFRSPFNIELTKIPKASLSIAGTTGDKLTIDITKNNTSIFNTLLTIDLNEKTSKTANISAVLSTTTILEDDELSFNIDLVPNDATGAKVTLYYRRA